MNNQDTIITPAATEEVSAPAVAEASAVPAEAVIPGISPAADITEPSPADSGSKTADRLAAASFIFGLIGVILLPIGLIFGFFGFAFNLDARRRGSTHSKMDAGRILSLIAMLGMPLVFTALGCTACESLMYML